MSKRNHPEGLGRLSSEIFFLDDKGPARIKFAFPLEAEIEELERKIAGDDQSSAGFLDRK